LKPISFYFICQEKWETESGGIKWPDDGLDDEDVPANVQDAQVTIGMQYH